MSKRTITQTYFYDAAPGTVFRALTEPKQLTGWFLDSARIKPVEGSGYTFAWKGYPNQKGEVKKVVTDRLLVLSWPNKVKGKVLLTEARFTLKKNGRGTLLTVRHTGFGEGDDWIWLYGAVQSGWAYFLTNLKSVLSQGLDLRSEHDQP
ncbi:MAG TPA: SRPBCC domain-containing protein [Nitrososphaerales archaeon]|nr:SRPBCC domain-containing protein [Nitrososphaerales archaeon]